MNHSEMCMLCQSAMLGKYFFFAVSTIIDLMIIGTDPIIDPKNTVCSGTWLGTFFVILVYLVLCDHNLATLETKLPRVKTYAGCFTVP